MDLVKRYLGALTPEQVLANQINIYNIAQKEGWSKAAVSHIRKELGVLAMNYKHYFEDGL